MRSNLLHIVFLATFLTICCGKVQAQDLPAKPLNVSRTPDNTMKVSLPTTTSDTSKKGSVEPKKPVLEDIVRRKAKGYERMNQKTKQLTLYDEAELYYQDVELTAGIIVMNYETNEVSAGRIKDSTGTLTQRPVFKQGTNVVEPDSIRFNTKTKKVIIYNSRSQQGELNFISEIAKRENDSVYFLSRTKFTTSEDIDNPEYYFLAQKAKFVPKKKVVVGFTNMYIADVPTPIAVPFAFFPMTTKSQSGVLIPTFNDTNNRGYSLQNGGYYFAISDYLDLKLTGDYFTNGSYGIRAETNYALRYKFRGNVNFRYENQVFSERGFPDYSRTTLYNIQWSHAQDGKSNPNSRFSASVNLGSSQFFQTSFNQMAAASRLNNTLASSVSYSKTFNWEPQVNITLSATHSQNTQSQVINMTLPTFNASMDRVFPFAPKEGIKKGFFQNINFQYNVLGENRINTTDSLFFKPEMFRDAQAGMRHSIPINTNIKLFKYFSVPFNVNYNEVWYIKTINRRFDQDLNQVVEREVGGFDSFRTYNFSTGIGTTIYGTYDFGDKGKLKAIRHVMRPTVSYNYTPSFDRYYDTYATDASGNMQKEYTRFENGIYGAPQRNYSNVLGFQLSNTFEAKVTDKDSTKTEYKKIMLLNNLNFQTGYDISADSLRWSPVRVSGSTLLFKEKMNVNLAATLDPYSINAAGRRINTFNIDNGGSLFRLTSANVTMNYSFDSNFGNKKNNAAGEENQRNGGREDDLFGTATDFGDRRKSQFDEDDEDAKPLELYAADIPWDLTLAYSLTYSNDRRQGEITGNSIMASGNLTLTPKWKIGASTGYDFVQKGITYTQLRFERDLLSWRMDFPWVPIDIYKSWGFFIGIKSGMLSDIKWERQSLPEGGRR